MDNVIFDVEIIDPRKSLPSSHSVSAVFLIALSGNNIVAIRNHRGWDLPAGHVEDGETLLGALQRETQEEASMRFQNAIPLAVVTSNSKDQKYAGKCMVGYMTKEFIFDPFTPAPDSEERKLMDKEEFLLLYQGNRENMKLIVDKAYKWFSL